MLSIIALASLSGVPASATCRAASAPATGGVIAYRDCGNRAQRPVLLIPGGPGLDARYMRPLADMIVKLHHRVILIEPRGTGASRAALGDGAQLTVAGSIADVEAVRQAAHLEKPIVFGHSFGGQVAQAYAAAFPDRVRALVLLDSAGPGVPPPQPLDGWRKRGTPEDLARYDALRAGGDRVGAMRIKFKLSFFDPAAADAFLAGLSDGEIHTDVMPLSADYERNFHMAPMARPPFPITLVMGEIDWIRGNEPAFRVIYPTSRLLLVPDAGHFPWADAPGETRKALAQALAD